LQTMTADGIVHTKKKKKNSPESDMINLVIGLNGENC
jgi:hypothetical protein